VDSAGCAGWAVPHTHDITREPTGATYRALLTFAERYSGSFSLVWRHQLAFDASAAVIATTLRPFLIERSETSEWPGTTLIGHLAIVRRYRLTAESVRELATAAGLFAWKAPARPEDLAFYAPTGRCWLGSIAHERAAFLVLDAGDFSALQAAVPELQARPRRGGEMR
jgi:hypothetical protein